MRPPAPLTVEALERHHPEWATWLTLYGIARRAAADATWETAVPAAPPGDGVQAPLIAGTAFSVDARAATRLVGALLEGAGARTLAADAAVDALDAAVAQDAERLRAAGDSSSIDPDLLSGIATLIALPLLQACGRAWRARIPIGWRHGTCPVCGAWAALAEARGVERTLRLRCARCGGDWATEPVRCPFCGEKDHEKLRALVADAKADLRRVEACMTCHGYAKTVTTLTACAPLDVALLDLATVDLDVAALEHGCARPPAASLATRVRARATRRLRGFLSRDR